MTEDLRAVARKSENGAMILPYDVTTKNIVWADMQTAYLLMDSVASGRKPMQQIGSPTGFGKTTIAKQRFKNYGIVSEQEFYRSLPPLPAIPPANFPSMPAHLLKAMPQTRKTGMRRAVQGLPPFENAKKRLFIESGPKEPISLVRILFQCAMLGAARFLFDDPGKIAGDEASCDILKTALGMQRTVTYETPEISRNENLRISGHSSYNPFISPPDFPIPGDLGWLWLANLNYTDEAVLAKLGDHFAALVARGLNPFWIRDDVAHDHHDLFLYVHWLATEQNLLRSMGFKYDVVRRAVNFYITHSTSLVDLCPRRLELLAQAFATDQPPAALEAALTSMAPRVIRPNLKLPVSWVTVPDGVLLWPETPFSKTKPTVEGEAPRRIRKRERNYKRLHGRSSAATPPDNPDPESPPPAATQPVPPVSDPEPDPEPAPVIAPPPPNTSTDTAPVIDAPAPEPPLELPLAVLVTEPDPAPELTIGQAVHAVYALDERTCDRVADILDRSPLEAWDDAELMEVAQALDGCSEWHVEHVQAICHTFAQHSDGPLLFCTSDDVLVWEGPEKGLQIYRWDAVREIMAPHIEAARRKEEPRQREEESRKLVVKKLPAKLKLKAVKERLNRLIALGTAKFSDEAQRAIEHIRQMPDDDERYSDCKTLQQYVGAVIEYHQQQNSS
jgi:hypothetical protein